jgi:hypothetical protein
MKEVIQEVARRREIVNSQILGSFEKGKKEMVGAIKSWGGRDYKKVADGKWVPVTEGKSSSKPETVAGKHYSDMNKEELHMAASKLGISNHEDLGVKELRSKVADHIINSNIKRGIEQMRSNQK